MDVPDFQSLAQQQAAGNQQVAGQATLANRANQTNSTGSLTWSVDPATGQWTQNTSLNAPQQGVNNALAYNQYSGLNQANYLQDNANGIGTGLGQGVNSQGLSDWGSTDITKGVSAMPDGGFGATQGVIDAWDALQQPGLQKNQDAERTRMATMGITQGSDASNDSERNLGNIATDSRNKSILAGTTEYGNVFNRGLAQRQQGIKENTDQSNLMSALREKQFDERVGAQTSNMATISGLRGGVSAYADPKFSSYASATTAPAADVYGAGRDSWAATQQMYRDATAQQTGANNAAAAGQANSTAGTMGMLGLGIKALGIPGVSGALGDMWGNMTGAAGSNSWWGGGADGTWGGNWNTGEDFMAGAQG